MPACKGGHQEQQPWCCSLTACEGRVCLSASLSALACPTGAPAISVPVALTTAEGLPVGLQLIAAPMAEARLLAAAHVLAHQSQRHSDAAGGKSLLMPLRSPNEGKAPIDTV